MRARELRRDSPDAERVLWRRLRDRQLGGYKFRRQRPIGRYIADFACIEAGLVIELDGGQHFEAEAIAADASRTVVLNAHGYQILRFTNHQALAETEAVLAAILHWLQTHHPHPSPLPQAGEGVRAPATAVTASDLQPRNET